MTLKSSVVIFWVISPLQPQWPLWPQQPQWPQWPRQPHFIIKIPQHDGWIIPSAQMTNTSPFLWNKSSKIQFFTDIWYPFCQRLLRPAYVTFLKTLRIYTINHSGYNAFWFGGILKGKFNTLMKVLKKHFFHFFYTCPLKYRLYPINQKKNIKL